MYELFSPFSDARSTSYPRVVEAVNPHLEGVNPLFDYGPDVLELIAQSYPGERTEKAVAIDKKHCLRKTGFSVNLCRSSPTESVAGRPNTATSRMDGSQALLQPKSKTIFRSSCNQPHQSRISTSALPADLRRCQLTDVPCGRWLDQSVLGGSGERSLVSLGANNQTRGGGQ